MFLVKSGTVIQVEAPKSETHFYWSGWLPYKTKEDKIYDTHEVWDRVTISNGRIDVPEWAQQHITKYNKVVISRKGKYALVNATDIEYLD